MLLCSGLSSSSYGSEKLLASLVSLSSSATAVVFVVGMSVGVSVVDRASVDDAVWVDVILKTGSIWFWRTGRFDGIEG